MELSRRVLPSQYSIHVVKYYTARVSGILDPGQPQRQQTYLSALRTVPGIQVIFGNFLAKTVCRPLASVPIANREIVAGSQRIILPVGNHQVMPDSARTDSIRETMPVGSYPLKSGKVDPRPAPVPDAIRVRVHWMEEKGSDVNLATHLINDAWAGRFDAAAVLSNDTDLVEPIRIVTREINKPVIIVCASTRGAAPALKTVASGVLHVSSTHLRRSLFPTAIAGTSITKPPAW